MVHVIVDDEVKKRRVRPRRLDKVNTSLGGSAKRVRAGTDQPARLSSFRIHRIPVRTLLSSLQYLPAPTPYYPYKEPSYTHSRLICS